MAAWKILVTDGLDEKGQAILRSAAQVDDRKGIDAHALDQCIGSYDAMVVRGRTKVTAELVAKGTRLKVIGRAGVGVDNIDLNAAVANHVTVVNAPTATSLAVVELTLGLIFALARRLPRADAKLKKGQWAKKELLGIELNDKILGVIGVGNIGRRVATHALALGMSVLGYDAFIPPEAIRQWGLEAVSLADLYARADIISLHIPLSAKTRMMINRASIRKMKRGVRLVCTARGGIIDEAALLEELESGHVAGAALDVFTHEPPGLTALVAHPNVIATPHIGAQTAEAQARVAVDIAEEVLAALHGEELRWKVV